MRIRVSDVLDRFVAGLSAEPILEAEDPGIFEAAKAQGVIAITQDRFITEHRDLPSQDSILF
jgi:predicted nuclease of predicted toxin-antitoxin system